MTVQYCERFLPQPMLNVLVQCFGHSGGSGGYAIHISAGVGDAGCQQGDQCNTSALLHACYQGLLVPVLSKHAIYAGMIVYLYEGAIRIGYAARDMLHLFRYPQLCSRAVATISTRSSAIPVTPSNSTT